MRTSLLMVIVAALLYAGCGPSREDYTAAMAARDSLATLVDTLKAEVDELRNGAPRRFSELKAASDSGDWNTAIAIYEMLKTRHPGTSETEQAKPIAARAEKEIMAAAARDRAEAEAKQRDAEKNARDRARDIIRVSRLYVSDPNSAGGVDLEITLTNRSKKTIKYAVFRVEAFNAVGDPVPCTIRDYTVYGARVTGPIGPGQSYGWDRVWENAWYNHSIVKGVLRGIEIEYTDGTTVSLTGKDLEYVRY